MEMPRALPISGPRVWILLGHVLARVNEEGFRAWLGGHQSRLP